LHNNQEKFYNMKLKGVIVHSGSADVGHYYLITKRNDYWYKLDDSRSSIFTKSSFDTECYGGSFTSG
jgi:ubiquitin carboxyl-terminal hydrolase 34